MLIELENTYSYRPWCLPYLSAYTIARCTIPFSGRYGHVSEEVYGGLLLALSPWNDTA